MIKATKFDIIRQERRGRTPPLYLENEKINFLDTNRPPTFTQFSISREFFGK